MEQLFKKYNLSQEMIQEVLSTKKYHRIASNNYIPREKEIDEFLYNECSLPIYKIAMLQGISDATTKSDMKNFGIQLKGHKIGKNSHNRYFKNIIIHICQSII